MTTAPDIIFIVLDTQRADRLGCYGYERPITPNLDRFAAEGVLFEQAISPAQWTIPSHASLFTGLYPTAHGVTQSSHSLNPGRAHLAEIMGSLNYETIGFCNNPLVGVLNNGFKRGFETFYNYGGAVPSLPKSSTTLPWPLNQLVEGYTQFLRRISYPVQNFFGTSDLAFRVSLHAWLTPIWAKLSNFKGQNPRSVYDVADYLKQRDHKPQEKPLFLFLNLMETHLPFWPPGEYIDHVAPYFRQSREARDILRDWNREAYRWAAPLEQPLPEMEHRVLNDLYDAEVNFQDGYLGELFETLRHRKNADNTLTIIVADHGDGLGDHNLVGHAFVAYQELVHVPLIVHWPGQIAAGQRIETPVSTRRIFHTVLDAAAAKDISPLHDLLPADDAAAIHRLSLRRTIDGPDPEGGTAFSEVYPPMNFAKALQQRQPEVLAKFRCLELRRAIVRTDNDKNEPLKLITISDLPEELFNLTADPLELENCAESLPAAAAELERALEQMIDRTTRDGEMLPAASVDELDEDDLLRDHLRGLGYIE